jgi:hypothetical protein
VVCGGLVGSIKNGKFSFTTPVRLISKFWPLSLCLLKIKN